MTDYMFTVYTKGIGARDVQVNNAPTMRDGIAIAEKITGCRVDHGRGGILPLFDPAVIIDAVTGKVEQRHDNEAVESMTIVNHARERGVSVPRGE